MDDASARHRSIIVACAVVTLLGCALVVVTNFIGIIVVDDHNPIRETISKLAIGEHAWIQDVGLDAYAIGFFTLALGFYLMKLNPRVSGSWRWRFGLVGLVLLGIDVLLIAEHNQYAGRPGRGAALHIYFVYALYALFTLVTMLLASGLQVFGKRWYYFSLGLSVTWFFLAPFFFFVPTSWDGLFERFLGLLMLVWTAGLAWLLVRQHLSSST